jgi:hypothetical protein
VVDRRRYPRVALEVPVLVDSLRSWEACETSDISPGGVAIRSGRDWGPGAFVDLYFELPGGFAVDARAQFLGAADGLGRFRFVDLAPQARCAIKLHMQTTHHSGARAVVHVG